MKVHCDKVLTTDDFDVEYASWKGRTLTVMGDYIKVSQLGLQPRYFDTIYLFEKTGVLIGFKYDSPVNECYLTTQDGQESECYADAMPFLYEDCQHTYAVVKRSYRNVDLKRQVIGLGIIDTATLTSLDPKFTMVPLLFAKMILLMECPPLINSLHVTLLVLHHLLRKKMERRMYI